MTLEEKKQQLAALMDEYTKQDVCLALSGGVDSALLAWWAGKYAAKNQRKVYGVTFDTVLHPAADLEAARQSARDAGILHKVITVNELEFAEIADNPRNRCYLCKKGLFEQLIRFGKERGISTFLEGTNQDDLSVYRPGLQAVRELGVHSPLAQCQITKAEVRQLAREAGIQVASRPSAPCMATRLPYWAELSYEVLKQIEEGEAVLRELIGGNVRLRLHGDVARIETDGENLEKAVALRSQLISRLKALGFVYITLDLEGFRSGSMDVHIRQA